MLVAHINRFCKNLGQHWMILRHFELLDKCANLGLYLQDMIKEYELKPETEKIYIDNATTVSE